MASLSAANILPLASFKARASEVLNTIRRDQRPVVITQNGAAAARFVGELMDRVLVLAEQPRSGRLVSEVGTE